MSWSNFSQEIGAVEQPRCRLPRFCRGVVVLLLWLAGKFAAEGAERDGAAALRAAAVQGREEFVRMPLPRYESAVGTVRAVHETAVGSKLLARVVEVDLKAGQKVKANDVLVRLDDTDLQAKLKQANAAVAAAEAVDAQASPKIAGIPKCGSRRPSAAKSTRRWPRHCERPRRNCSGQKKPSSKCKPR